MTAVIITLSDNFNPRSREGSDEKATTKTIPHFLFQSTLPRRERRKVVPISICIMPISIHAPAKGATEKQMINDLIKGISIHAPAKGATRLEKWELLYFRISIHAPAKGATSNSESSSSGTLISIHAPAKGATRNMGLARLSMFDFNPRSREGSDPTPFFQ